MQINADYRLRVVEKATDAVWRPSPAAGVERRMLDRVGDEVAVATSVVRYAAGSRFPTHVHERGEEFLVLEGTFSDTAGDYGPGFYIRNPPGTSHAPWTDGGTTILVKLRQFDAHDSHRVAVDTRAANWQTSVLPGCEELLLHEFEGERVYMYRLSPGSTFPAREIPGGEEIYVVAGAIKDLADTYASDTWIRYPPGKGAAFRAVDATVVWIKSGHLDVAYGPDRAATWK
jgi:anti-sigma factor ChrR (cupin superfamily)